MGQITPEPFSIRIYLADGVPDGIRVVEKPGWTGCAVVFPRTKFAEVKKRREFARPGVYLLLGDPGSEQRPEVYIGEGDPVSERLIDHFRKRDFWTSAMFFTSRDENLHKAHLQYLEASLIRLAKDANRCSLKNEQQPTDPSLSEIDAADTKAFLAQLLLTLNVLGISVFHRPAVAKIDTVFYHLEAKGLASEGYETDEGFVVKQGSRSPAQEVSSCPAAIIAARQELVKQRVLVPDGDRLVLTQDYAFTSPSQAAAIMLARSANGRIEWKTIEGQTLKQVQEAELDRPGATVGESAQLALVRTVG